MEELYLSNCPVCKSVIVKGLYKLIRQLCTHTNWYN